MKSSIRSDRTRRTHPGSHARAAAGSTSAPSSGSNGPSLMDVCVQRARRSSLSRFLRRRVSSSGPRSDLSGPDAHVCDCVCDGVSSGPDLGSGV